MAVVAPTVELRSACVTCGWAFGTLWSRADGQLICPRCDTPICGCGCGASLAGLRVDALWASEACKKSGQQRESRDKAGTIGRAGIRLGDVRSVEEATALQETYKEQWVRRVLERIQCALDTRGEYHADDTADLLLPAAHVNLIGTQVMSLLNRSIITKAGERRNKARASNARKSGIYKYTANGPAMLADLIAGLSAGGSPIGDGDASVEPGESGAGVPTAQAEGGASASVPWSASTTAPEIGQASLLPAPDPKAWAA